MPIPCNMHQLHMHSSLKTYFTTIGQLYLSGPF